MVFHLLMWGADNPASANESAMGVMNAVKDQSAPTDDWMIVSSSPSPPQQAL
jgi:hypothetical protein